MARLFLFVRDPAEVAIAIEAGADRLGVRLSGPEAQASTMLPALAAAIDGRRPLSLVYEEGSLVSFDDVEIALRESGADEVRLPLGDIGSAAVRIAGEIPLVAIVSPAFAQVARHGADRRLRGLMVSAGTSPKHRLIGQASVTEIAQWVAQAHAKGMSISLSGALEAADVPRLLPLDPDELCFECRSVRADQPSGQADADALRLLRDLMTGEAVENSESAGPLPPEPDRIFLRDWVLPIAIGAYVHEHGAPQRVRFSVDASIARRRRKVADLRDVVSYDLITDSIRRLTAGHVDLVETLAEQIAEAVLTHPRVLQVTVTVEKLDLGPGALGCRITRDKAG